MFDKKKENTGKVTIEIINLPKESHILVNGKETKKEETKDSNKSMNMND